MRDHAAGMLGWRLWRLRDGVLRSWTLSYDWSPGRNQATCLSPRSSRCQSSPGGTCQCGFWALDSPLECLLRGRHQGIGWWPVMGLMRGWGTVAVHGQEGFRAQAAAVVCLFSDWPFVRRQVDDAPLPGPLRRRLHALLEGGDGGPLPSEQRERSEMLKRTAPSYGVPLVSFADSVRLGLLQELGVDGRIVDEIARWTRVKT